MNAVTPSLVRRYVERLGSKGPVLALRAPLGWQGGRTLRVSDGEVEVAECRSPLEVREQLVLHRDAERRLVILTAIPEPELGEDVLARFAGRRLHSVEPWDLVRDLFGLRRIDPRLDKEPWVATALLERAPAGGHPPLSTGVLDRETAWKLVLDAWFGIELARPDALVLLRWAIADANVARYESAPEELRDGLRAWVSETAGAVGALILDCLAAGAGADALPLGVACDVVFAKSDADAVGRAQAAVRLERYTRGTPLTPETGRRFAEVAGQLVGELLARTGLRKTLPWLERADAMLAECGAAGSAHLGTIARCAFEARLARVGVRLREATSGASSTADGALAEAVEAVRAHQLAAHESDRVDQVAMAARLVRWLRAEAGIAEAGSLAAAATAYARSGAFVDWARNVLRGGEPVSGLSAAYGELLTAVSAACERRSRRFGQLLAGWGEHGGQGAEVLPIEGVLDRVVAPLAALAPVLLVVLDGMSEAVCVELLDALARRGWAPLRQPGLNRESACPSTVPVVAAFPTVTEVCRASLLSGAMGQGVSADEKRAFAAHAALRAASTLRHPPLLLHKAELTDPIGGGLSAEARAAVAAPERRVVGAVLNAVDDHLSGSDQVRMRWGLDTVPLLQALLQEAQAAGRVVILTSDHGHVVERGTVLRRSDLGDRYRSAAGDAQDDEVMLRGPRVRAPGGAIIAPWSEAVRYGGKKNGYHGGAAPAEVVVPLAVLAPAGLDVAGWEEVTLDLPAWWEESAAAVPPAQVPARRAPRGRPQGELFAAPQAAASWIDQLLGAPLLAERRARSSRLAVADDRLRIVLAALDARGGRITRPALAQQIGVAPLRLTGILAGMSDLLNVDGYAILTVDGASDTVVLDRDLLRVQFALDA